MSAFALVVLLIATFLAAGCAAAVHLNGGRPRRHDPGVASRVLATHSQTLTSLAGAVRHQGSCAENEIPTAVRSGRRWQRSLRARGRAAVTCRRQDP